MVVVAVVVILVVVVVVVVTKDVLNSVTDMVAGRGGWRGGQGCLKVIQ